MDIFNTLLCSIIYYLCLATPSPWLGTQGGSANLQGARKSVRCCQWNLIEETVILAFFDDPDMELRDKGESAGPHVVRTFSTLEDPVPNTWIE